MDKQKKEKKKVEKGGHYFKVRPYTEEEEARLREMFSKFQERKRTSGTKQPKN